MLPTADEIRERLLSTGKSGRLVAAELGIHLPPADLAKLVRRCNLERHLLIKAGKLAAMCKGGGRKPSRAPGGGNSVHRLHTVQADVVAMPPPKRPRQESAKAPPTEPPPPADAGPDLATLDRAAFLRWQLTSLQAVVRDVDPRYPSHIQAVRASGEIHAALAALAAEGQEKPDAATLTPEQWRQRVLDDAKAATVEDLELYVVEWLDRHRLDMAVEQGTPVIRRRSA